MFTKNYAAARFRSILLVSTFALIVEYVVLLSHSVIVGQMLGNQALAALGIVTPLFSFVVFVAFIITNELFSTLMYCIIINEGGAYTDGTESVAEGPMEELLRRRIIEAQKSKKFSLSGGDNRTVFQF